MANKTKERGSVMGQIEHNCNVVRDLETKLHKRTELLQELVERKKALQQEIEELEAQVAAALHASQRTDPDLTLSRTSAGCCPSCTSPSSSSTSRL